MATFGEIHSYTVQAAADLRQVQYHVMRFAAAGTTNIASHSAAAFTVGPIGFLQNKPNSGQAANIGYLGESKVVAGAAITAGVLLSTDGSGRAVAAASGDVIVGRALEAAGAAAEVIRALIFPVYRIGTL